MGPASCARQLVHGCERGSTCVTVKRNKGTAAVRACHDVEAHLREVSWIARRIGEVN
jgi:hypothetical protein